jgi:Icc-related predicted phosphoesterase
MTKVTCISDLHGYEPELKGGDILIVAGDCTALDEFYQWGKFFKWLKDQKYTRKILVGGNHDNFLQSSLSTKEAKEMLGDHYEDDEDFEYLCDTSINVEGLKIYGSPWTLRFHGQNPIAKAFSCLSEDHISEYFDKIPDDTDILVTHTPPLGIFDDVMRLGSESLLKRVKEVKPKYHIFGHIHECGQKQKTLEETTYINCSICDRYYDARKSQMDFEICHRFLD